MWGERTRALAPALPPGDASETLPARPTVQASSLHLDSKVLSDLPSSFVDRTPGTWDPPGRTREPGGCAATRSRKRLVAAALPAAHPRPGRERESPSDRGAQVHIFLEGRATSRREASEDRSPEEHAPAPSSAARCSALPGSVPGLRSRSPYPDRGHRTPPTPALTNPPIGNVPGARQLPGDTRAQPPRFLPGAERSSPRSWPRLHKY